MQNLTRLGTLLLALAVMTTVARAASKEHDKPDATLRLKGGAVAVGIGYSWGGGTLTYKGKDHEFKVNGLSLGKVGISGASATGDVYNLKKLKDIEGHYNAGGAGMTVVAGRNAVAMKNQHGVQIVLTSTTRGVDVTIAGGGVDIKLKKK